MILLVLALVVVPLVELAVIIEVGGAIGALDTLGLLLLVSIVGVYVVKRQGLGVLRRIQRERMEGRVPTAALADGALILVAGVLLLAPGFVTDVAAILLLLPPVRAGVRAALRRRWSRRVVGRRDWG